MTSSKGFTLLELLIVVAIIGIISAAAIPNLQEALHRAKISRAMADLKGISLALELYRVDSNFVPYISGLVPVQTIPELSQYTNSSMVDGWGNPYFYYSDGEGNHYYIASKGADQYWDGYSGPPNWDTPQNFKSYRCRTISVDSFKALVKYGCDIKFLDGAPIY